MFLGEGRPIKWIPSRSEALLGDAQGRDQNVTAELALDADGKFLALRWTGSHNVGAYIEGAGAPDAKERRAEDANFWTAAIAKHADFFAPPPVA